MKKIGILTSGGDCQGLNAAIRGVAKGLYEEIDDVEIYGIQNGYAGLIHGDYKKMNQSDFSGILTIGGTILGTSRQPFKMMRVIEDENSIDKVAAMKDTYKKIGLDCLVILGGNGTHKTANLLSEEGLNVVTMPKTIDNDLCVTDHTPGYGSAAKYVASTLLEIGHDTSIYPIKSVTIVEIMGRDAGWLTGASVLARNKYNFAPHLIYLPEVPFVEEEFIEDVKAAMEKYNNIVIAVSEGIKDANGKYVSATTAVEDTFGHSQLSGTGKCLEYIIKQNIQVKVRSVEINILQRSAAHMSSITDIGEAFRLGRHAINISIEGKTGVMVTAIRKANDPYCVTMSDTPVQNVAGLVKHVPREWINARGNDVTQEFIDYAYPLILGEPVVKYQRGIPDYLDISHLFPNMNDK